MSKENTTASKKKSVKKQNRVAKYLKELKSELKKVVWPSKKQVINNTAIVLVTVVASALFIAGIDLVFKWVVNLML